MPHSNVTADVPSFALKKVLGSGFDQAHGRTVVTAMDPTRSPGAQEHAGVARVANVVRDKLARVLDRLE